MAVVNGRLDAGTLASLATATAQRLRIDAAASWDRLARAVQARYGWLPAPTDSYRPDGVQERIFLERYQTTRIAYAAGKYDRRVWRGVAYWRKPGHAAAAVPGTSNHGLGLAVDVTSLGGFTGTRYAQLASLATAHGWDNAEGRAVNEAWHWTYTSARDQHARPTPTPSPQEDEMSAEDSARLARIEAMLAVPGQPFGYPAANSNKLDAVAKTLASSVTSEQVAALLAEVKAVRASLAVPGQPFDYPAATHNAVGSLIARVAALQASVSALAVGHGADPAAITAAAEAGAKKALEGITVTVKGA